MKAWAWGLVAACAVGIAIAVYLMGRQDIAGGALLAAAESARRTHGARKTRKRAIAANDERVKQERWEAEKRAARIAKIDAEPPSKDLDEAEERARDAGF